MDRLDKLKVAFAPNNDEGFTVEKDVSVLEEVKNWEEDGSEVRVKDLEAAPTARWQDGWYRNPTSGRSNNYGINTRNPKKHSTVVLKGGRFFINNKIKDFFASNSVAIDELYGSISFNEAKKEYDIATLIQESFKSLLNKKAPCPEPIDVHHITHVLDKNNEIVEPVDFFLNETKTEKTDFTANNFIRYALKLGIDASYPSSESADEATRKNPFRWLLEQCFEKRKQGIYRYKIEGPNTRLLDLMTLDLETRKKSFIKANNAKNIQDALKKFSGKLGEFYGVLHKSNISYHSDSAEHCTLVDITVAGVVMDIGGLSQDNSVKKNSMSYNAQMLKTANLITYLCTYVFDVDKKVLERALNTFWGEYKDIYTNQTIEHYSEHIPQVPDKIRTQYLDALTGDWVELAPDLKAFSSNG